MIQTNFYHYYIALPSSPDWQGFKVKSKKKKKKKKEEEDPIFGPLNGFALSFVSYVIILYVINIFT